MIFILNSVSQSYISACLHPHKLKFSAFLTDRYGDYIRNISDEIVSVSVSSKYTQGCRASCQLTLKPDFNISDEDFIFSPDNRIALFSEIEEYRFNEGCFIPASVSLSERTITVDLLDKFALFTDSLNNHTLTENLTIRSGSNIATAVSDILTIDDGTNHPTDPIVPIINHRLYSEILPIDIEISQNSFIGKALTEIASVCSSDIYYNPCGQLVIEDNIPDSDFRFASAFSFKSSDRYFRQDTLSTDYTKIINMVTVCGTDKNGLNINATVRNNNSRSPNRIQLVGLKPTLIQTDLCDTAERCSDYAEYLLRKYSLSAKTVSFSYCVLPHLREGNIIDFDNERYFITDLTKNFTENTMSVTATNVQYI